MIYLGSSPIEILLNEIVFSSFIIIFEFTLFQTEIMKEKQQWQSPALHQQATYKQKQFRFALTHHKQQVVISSAFQSGNLANCETVAGSQNNLKLWIGGDTKSEGYRTWFYFSIQGVPINQTITFTIMNMSNQVKLFKEGHLPVYKNQNLEWRRIKTPLQQNSIVKGEEGYQFTFKHTFTQNNCHKFAFTYPWTVSNNNDFINSQISEISNKEHIYCEYTQFCQTYNNTPVNLLTLTYHDAKQDHIEQIPLIKNNQSIKQQTNEKLTKKSIVTFNNKKGIFISARVHPGQLSSSHTLNGFLKQLFTSISNEHPQIVQFLKSFVIYIIPILNPDGVIAGNFRTDLLGVNLNRYYSQPSQKQQPQIYYIKNMLVQMIKKKKIDFCLDLHGHVNKQGAFIYGNCISNLEKQTQVLLFPKILEFNSEIFDFEACNFSESNMGKFSKKKKQPENEGEKDQADKEGAARVTIYKESGLHRCWTLQCNYNSAKFTNLLPPVTQQNKNCSVSHGIISSKVSPETKQQVKLFNIPEFQTLGRSILDSIVDYYQIKKMSRNFGTKLKNMNNLRINTAIAALRLLPFRFDNHCRKMISNLNSQIQVRQIIAKLHQILNHPPKPILYDQKQQDKLTKRKIVGATTSCHKKSGILTKVETNGPLTQDNKIVRSEKHQKKQMNNISSTHVGDRKVTLDNKAQKVAMDKIAKIRQQNSFLAKQQSKIKQTNSKTPSSRQRINKTGQSDSHLEPIERTTLVNPIKIPSCKINSRENSIKLKSLSQNKSQNKSKTEQSIKIPLVKGKRDPSILKRLVQQ